MRRSGLDAEARRFALSRSRQIPKRGLVNPLPLLKELAPGAVFQRISFPVTEAWGRFNPSISRSDDGFLCVVRSSNAHIETGRYVSSTGGFPFLTENYLAYFDDDL